MAKFDLAIIGLLKKEGGYVNNPADAGKATKYGISLRWLQSLESSKGDVNNDGVVDSKDVESLSVEEATKLFKTYWWLPIYDGIVSQEVANRIFESAVVMGRGKAHELIQSALNELLMEKDRVIVDGIFGNGTLKNINLSNPRLLLQVFKLKQIEFYAQLVSRNKERKVFFEGWVRRALSEEA